MPLYVLKPATNAECGKKVKTQRYLLGEPGYDPIGSVYAPYTEERMVRYALTGEWPLANGRERVKHAVGSRVFKVRVDPNSSLYDMDMAIEEAKMANIMKGTTMVFDEPPKKSAAVKRKYSEMMKF
jgi:hypothetical protein